MYQPYSIVMAEMVKALEKSGAFDDVFQKFGRYQDKWVAIIVDYGKV